MSLAANANTDSDSAAWHAVSAAEVVKRLATNGEKGLDAAEASTRLQKLGLALALAGGLLFFVVVEAEKLVIRSSDALRKTVTAVEAGT